MITSLLILLFSVVLFVYWFRYTCHLILKTGRQVLAGRVAVGSEWCCANIHESLRTASEDLKLEPLQRSVEQDFLLLRYLFQHAADVDVPSLEQRLLSLDYQVMHIWYRLTRHASSPLARRALVEMSEIVHYLAARVGQRAASYSQA